jgi:cytochrome c biogenesis protein CcmG/thiol:disulfide interchange protein DsbE
MKKTVLILAVVVLGALGVYFADKATRIHTSAASRAVKFAAGDPAPDIKVKDLEDRDVTLADYKGKVVLVNFWATWCDPCRVEIPWLIEMQDKYGAKGFIVLGIAMDEEGKPVVAPFVAKERYTVAGQKLPMNYPIVIGDEKVAEKFGGLLGYPTSVLISREGKVLKRTTGLIDYDETTKMIEGALEN